MKDIFAPGVKLQNCGTTDTYPEGVFFDGSSTMETSITGHNDSKETVPNLCKETRIISVRIIGICVRRRLCWVFFRLLPRKKSLLSQMSDCDIIRFWWIFLEIAHRCRWARSGEYNRRLGIIKNKLTSSSHKDLPMYTHPRLKIVGTTTNSTL